MLKVMTIVGTRPEIIRLSRIIPAIDNVCEHTVVHTGQNYDNELSKVFFDELGIRKPDIYFGVPGTNALDTIAKIISKTGKLLNEMKPEAVLILGDTNSALAAIAAKRCKIPIFHMEAGNRAYDQRVPEEINRRIIDHIADINLTYSGIAREYLLREGLPPDQIIKVGSPMFEVLNYYRPLIDQSDILDRFGLSTGQFFVVSAHREENIESEKKFKKLIFALNRLGEEYDLPIIFSTHPRTRKKIVDNKVIFHNKVTSIKPLGFLDYVQLQQNSKVVLSDSGTITEEASILGFPALNIREAHERPEGMEEAAVVMVGLEFDRIRQGIEILDKQLQGTVRIHNIVDDYAVPNVSEKIVKLLHSYTDYVNRVVWKNY